jgi:hypothetical protein
MLQEQHNENVRIFFSFDFFSSITQSTAFAVVHMLRENEQIYTSRIGKKIETKPVFIMTHRRWKMKTPHNFSK